MDHQQLGARGGDLAFVRGTDPVGRLIRWSTRSEYSHVKIVVASYGQCVEAVPPRARLGRLESGDVLVPVPYASDAERAAAVRRAYALVGRPYGYLTILSDLLGLLGFPISFRRRASGVCSQDAAEVVGLALPDPDDVTPSGLYSAALAREVSYGAH